MHRRATTIALLALAAVSGCGFQDYANLFGPDDQKDASGAADRATDDAAGQVPDGFGLDPIDDMERGSLGTINIPASHGRSGRWFERNDATSGGSQEPPVDGFKMQSIPNGRGASQYAAHTWGGGFESWGAEMGFTFRDGASTYDGSRYWGVLFYAKLGDDRSTPTSRIQIAVNDPRVLAPDEGGSCEQDSCRHPFAATIQLTSSWQAFPIPFSAFTTEAAISPATVDTTRLVQMVFAAGPNTDFDFWIDDLSLVCSDSPCP
jgi:hypothetical protein